MSKRYRIKKNGYNGTRTVYITPFLFKIAQWVLIFYIGFVLICTIIGRIPYTFGYFIYYDSNCTIEEVDDSMFILSKDIDKYNLYLEKIGNYEYHIVDKKSTKCVGSVEGFSEWFDNLKRSIKSFILE